MEEIWRKWSLLVNQHFNRQRWSDQQMAMSSAWWWICERQMDLLQTEYNSEYVNMFEKFLSFFNGLSTTIMLVTDVSGKWCIKFTHFLNNCLLPIHIHRLNIFILFAIFLGIYGYRIDTMQTLKPVIIIFNV